MAQRWYNFLNTLLLVLPSHYLLSTLYKTIKWQLFLNLITKKGVPVKRVLSSIVYISLLLSATGATARNENNTKRCNDNFCDVRTAVHFRSQGANTARELVGWQWELNKPLMCEYYGSGYIAFEYQRSFKPEHLARAFFGSTALRFAGSLVPDRQSNELLAENFGLSRTFRGSIHFCPSIENFIVDLGFYLGLDAWVQGLYFRAHAPFVHARWKLGATQVRNNENGAGNRKPTFAPCFVGEESDQAAQTIEQALSGNFLFGDLKTRWCAGKFDFCKRTKNGLADIDLILGYNFINDDCYHLGFYAQAVIPTAKKRKNEFVFDPLIGNGRHFELGAGISAHTVLWSGEDANVALFLEGNITHMFKSRQCRLFDLRNHGPFSRYLLLKEFDSNGTRLIYNGNLLSATCFTSRDVNVSVDVKADFSLKLAYRWCGFGFDIGYNIYGHSAETIDRRCDGCPTGIDKRRFGIKGTENTCCFNFPVGIVSENDQEIPTIFPEGAPFEVPVPEGCPAVASPVVVRKVANNSTQADATAFRPGATVTPTIAASACTVCLTRADNVIAPIAVADLTPENGFIVTNTTRPTILTTNDLNLCSGEALSVLTHKVFGHICYTWMDECGWNPQLGLGAEVEFDGKRHRNGTERNGLNQWGIWIKGVISF